MRQFLPVFAQRTCEIDKFTNSLTPTFVMQFAEPFSNGVRLEAVRESRRCLPEIRRLTKSPIPGPGGIGPITLLLPIS
jgi:hypothetical protein